MSTAAAPAITRARYGEIARQVNGSVAVAGWLDPAVGLLIGAVAVRDGLEAWRGEGCPVASPLDGFERPCEEDSCAHG